MNKDIGTHLTFMNSEFELDNKQF